MNAQTRREMGVKLAVSILTMPNYDPDKVRDLIDATLREWGLEMATELRKVAFLHGNDRWLERKTWNDAAELIVEANANDQQKGA